MPNDQLYNRKTIFLKKQKNEYEKYKLWAFIIDEIKFKNYNTFQRKYTSFFESHI